MSVPPPPAMTLDPFSQLIILCFAMFGGSMVCVYLPLAISVSKEKMRIITTFGCGLLVGAALCIIIPEGIHALASCHEHGGHEDHDHTLHTNSVLSGGPTEVENIAKHDVHDHGHDHGEGGDGHGLIGVALLSGFVLQLLVDRLSGGSAGHGHSHGTSTPAHASDHDSELPILDDAKHSGKTDAARASAIGTLIGLLIHSAVDGIAIGAAAISKSGSVELVVFFAVMLHKAPAAFGISSFLLGAGVPRSTVLYQGLLFSAAAPVSAILTFFVLSVGLFTYENGSGLGLCLLFSAGTFLYVAAAHILPEVQQSEGHGRPLRWQLVGVLVVGMVMPLFMHSAHAH